MNWRGGWALIKRGWLVGLQSGPFNMVVAFSWLMPPLIALFVWHAISAKSSVGVLQQGEFVAYYLTFTVINQFTYAQTSWLMGEMIEFGNLNTVLLRPMSHLLYLFADEIATKIVYLMFVVPVAFVLGVFLRPEFHLTWDRGVLAVISVCLAWALSFFWDYWIALLAFWTTNVKAFFKFEVALMLLLAGQIAPVSLLPSWLQSLAYILPFRYMVGFPVEIVIGHLTVEELLLGFGMQCVWCAVAMGLAAWLWRQGIRRYSAHGG